MTRHHRIHWQPGVEEIVAREVAKALAPFRALVDDLAQDIADRREDTPPDDGPWPSSRAHWVGHIAGLGDALHQLRTALADPEEKP